MNKAKLSPRAVVVFLAALTFCSLLTGVFAQSKINAEKLIIERLIIEKGKEIDDSVSRLLYKTQALAALVIQSNGKIEEFDRIAAAIADDTSILNILVAPSGVVTNVYPLSGNEAVIGFNFFEEGAGNKEAIMAFETGELVFGGPFNTVQGGEALVGRLPVFLDTPEGEKSFWGLVSVTLKYPDVLKSANLDNINKNGLSYIIWRINPDDGAKQIIASCGNYDLNYPSYIEKEIDIMNAQWYFRIMPIRNWYKYADIWVFVIAGLCISFLVAVVTQRIIDLNNANIFKNLFLANMNHELRTPMSGIIGFAELASDGGCDEAAVRDYLNKIKNSAKGLLGLIDDLLDMSKIESRNIEVEKKPFSLQEIITLCETLGSLKAAEKKLTLSATLTPPVNKMVLGDPAMLRKILLNLISNAIKFTDEGFVFLSASVTAVRDEIFVRFEVSDSGIGMSASQIDNILEPFTQANSLNTGLYGGSGVGLTIASSLLTLMGSKLEVKSELGKGSTFSFTLNFELSGETAKSGEREEIPANQLPVFAGACLVCDDNETNQLVMKGHLSKLGLEAVVAQDGKIGVEMVGARTSCGKPFDLIFMDINMPVMDGLTATKMIKESGDKTPIIALTANTTPDDLNNYRKHGIEITLSKPFKAQALRECLLKYLTPTGYIAIPEKTVHKASSTAIDKEAGLLLYDRDETVYNDILENFARKNKDTFSKINKAVHVGDIELAYRLSHSLRGAAGTIGALRLTDAATGIEKALLKAQRDGIVKGLPGADKSIGRLLKALESEFNSVCGELQYEISETKHRAELFGNIDNIDNEQVLELLNKLTPLLEKGDSKSLEYLDEIEGVFCSIAEQCRLFITQIEQYDFELAYETMKSIRQFIKS